MKTPASRAAYVSHAIAGLMVLALGIYAFVDALLKEQGEFGTRQALGMLVFMPLLLGAFVAAMFALAASLKRIALWRLEPLIPVLSVLLVSLVAVNLQADGKPSAVVYVLGGAYAFVAVLTGWRSLFSKSLKQEP